MKYLMLFLLACIVWLAWKKGRRPLARPPAERPAETMVVCAHCGVYLPSTESLKAAGLHYCSQAHLKAAASRQS